MIDAQQYGPWALIAGGSEGIGAAFADELGKAGFNLVVIARRDGPLESTAQKVRAESGVEVRTLALDMSRSDMLDGVREVTDDIDVGLLVYNVGKVYGSGSFLGRKLGDIHKTIQLNANGQTALSHQFGNKMVARGRGGIVLVGSLAGNAGGATMVLYSAGKAFAQIFAEGLWAELKPLGVDVAYIVVGATNTPVRASQGYVDDPNVFVAEPEDVARDALNNIANGPVIVPSYMVEGFEFFSSAPRRQAAETMRDLLTGMDKESEAKAD